MGKFDKLLVKILHGKADNNINFKELTTLMQKLGFQVRDKGSHHIFFKEGIDEIVNLQEIDGQAKAYQVKQIREIVLRYNLKMKQKDEI